MIRIYIVRCPQEQLPRSTYRAAQIIIDTAFSCEAVRQDTNPEHSEVKEHSFENLIMTKHSHTVFRPAASQYKTVMVNVICAHPVFTVRFFERGTITYLQFGVFFRHSQLFCNQQRHSATHLTFKVRAHLVQNCYKPNVLFPIL